jgi:putative ABC transport system permease protein
VILASDVSVVDALTATLPTLLASDIRVSASTDLVAMRAQVQTQVGLLGNGLVLGVLAASAVLVGMIQMVLVTMNRKDYGRRRALGARRSLIVQLVSAIALIEGMAGTVFGILLANTTMFALADPLPDAWFQSSVVVLALAASLAGSIVPAWFASHRDPISELRVP